MYQIILVAKSGKKRKKIEETEQIVEQVYSPLFFIFSELPYQLGYFAGFLNSLLEKGLSTEEVKDRYIRWSKGQGKKEKISHQIINILKTKAGSINPKDFWKDLFFFTIYLKDFEGEIVKFDEVDFKKENILILEERFQNLCKATVVFNKLIKKLLDVLDELIIHKGEFSKDIHEIIMKKELNEAIQYLIHKPWRDDGKQSYSRFVEKFLSKEPKKDLKKT